MKAEPTPLTVLEGIGPQTERAFRERGYVCAEDLLTREPETVVRDLAAVRGVTAENLITSFIPQAALLRIDGMTAQIAEGLAASGIRTLRRFIATVPDRVITVLERRQQEGMIPKVPDRDQVDGLQRAASLLAGTSLVSITVLDADDGTGLAGAAVTHIGDGTQMYATHDLATNDDGVAVVDGLLEGANVIAAEGDGFAKKVVAIDLEPGRNRRLKLRLAHGESQPRIVDEADGGVIDFRRCVVRSRVVDFEDFAAPPPATVLQRTNGEVRLLSLWRRREDEVVYVYEFDRAAADIPVGSERRSLLLPDDAGRYQLSDQSIGEWRRQQRQANIAAMRERRRS